MMAVTEDDDIEKNFCFRVKDGRYIKV